MIFEVIEGSCTHPGGDNRIVFGGNPTVISGYCHDSFNRDKDSWKLFTWNAEESPIVDKGNIARIARKWGKHSDVYRVRVLGLPPKGNPDAFIQLIDIEAAVAREVELEGDIELGVDCARFGDDLTVIASRMGFHFFPLQVKERTDEVDIRDFVLKRVRELRKRYKYNKRIKIKIDTTGGYGGGAYDLLKRNKTDNLEVVGINFGSGGDAEYTNLTGIMWGEFRDNLDYMQLPDDTDLIAELSTRRWKMKPHEGKEKIEIEPKAQFKEDFEQSPDRSDAIILCYTQSSIKRVIPLFLSTSSEHCRRFKIRWETLNVHNSLIYGSVYYDKDASINIVLAFWEGVGMHLYVYKELVYAAPTCELIAMALAKNPVKFSKIIGNKEMFKKGIENIGMRLRREKVRVRQNPKWDEAASILIVNWMFSKNMITIHSEMNETIKCFNEWAVKNKQPEKHGFGCAYALCNMASELKEQGVLKKLPPLRGYERKEMKERWQKQYRLQQDKLIDSPIEDGGSMA